MKAQLCPKCNGQGYYEQTPYIPPYNQQITATTTNTCYQCDLCNGGKVIYIPDKGCYPAYCPEKYMGEI